MRNKLALLIFSTVWISTNAFRDCSTSYYQLTTNQKITVNSPGYPPYGVPNPSSCQFTIAAPIYHGLSVTCSYEFGTDANNCDPNDSLHVLVDGTTNMDNDNPSISRYCGKNQFTLDTMYNSITIGYSSDNFSGYYTCDIIAKSKGSCDCGQRTISRIVGGERAKMNQYTYMAAIMKNVQNIFLKGGGTAISTNIILTAAHVVRENNVEMDPNQIYVSMGRADLAQGVRSDTLYAQNYEVNRIITHPSYDETTGTNDIAIILCKKYINFNRGVQPVCMPGLNEQEFQYDGQKLIALGFGSSEFSAAYTYYLKSAGVYGYQNEKCKEIYKNDEVQITTQELCTYSSDRNDTCQGDSGGPMILPSYRDFFVGIVKSGSGCGTSAPGVCERVSVHRSWIESNSPKYNYYCYYK